MVSSKGIFWRHHLTKRYFQVGNGAEEHGKASGMNQLWCPYPIEYTTSELDSVDTRRDFALCQGAAGSVGGSV